MRALRMQSERAARISTYLVVNQKVSSDTTAFLEHAVPRLRVVSITKETWPPHVGCYADFFKRKSEIRPSFIKILAPWILPEVSQLIILDFDMVVVAPIELLWNRFRRFGSALVGLVPEQSRVYQRSFGAQGWNGGVQLLNLAGLRESHEYFRALGEAYAEWRAVTAANYSSVHYHERKSVGDQTLYSIMSRRAPHFFFALGCEWNRQLGSWTADKGLMPASASFKGVMLEKAMLCPRQCGIMHANWGPLKCLAEHMQRDPSCPSLKRYVQTLLSDSDPCQNSSLTPEMSRMTKDMALLLLYQFGDCCGLRPIRTEPSSEGSEGSNSPSPPPGPARWREQREAAPVGNSSDKLNPRTTHVAISAQPGRYAAALRNLNANETSAVEPIAFAHWVVGPAERNAQRKMSERNNLARDGVSNRWRDLPLSAAQSSVAYMPPFSCPLELVRTSGTDQQYDGGKWLCGWSSLVGSVFGGTKRCVVYSFGSNFEPSFEIFIQIQMQNQCEVHTYDPTLYSRNRQKAQAFSQMLRTKYNVQLHDVGVAAPSDIAASGRDAFKRGYESSGGGNDRSQSIPQLLAANGHSRACVDVLKMDVEGFELALIRETPWHELCVGNLLVELHGHRCNACKNLRSSWRQESNRASTFARFVSLLKPLENAGLRLFSTEPTSVLAHYRDAFELSFVNVSWLNETNRAHWHATQRGRGSHGSRRIGAGHL